MDELGAAIIEIVRKHFEEQGTPVPIIRPETTFGDLDADNLDGIEIRMDVEDKFDVDLAADLTADTTIRELVEAVSLAQQASRA